LRFQTAELLGGQPEHEVIWETGQIPRDGFIQARRRHPVEAREIRIEHDAGPSDFVDARADLIGRI
jgi:hypothetical protein